MDNRKQALLASTLKTLATARDLLTPQEKKNAIHAMSVVVQIKKLREQEIKLIEEYNQSHPSAKLEVPETIDLNPKDDYSLTLFHYAAGRGVLPIVTQLIECKVDVNLKVTNPNTITFTPLMFAVCNGEEKIAQALINAGAELEATLEVENDRHLTALDIAVNAKELVSISLLLNHGAAIRDPKSLYNFLMKCDINWPETQFALDKLCEQQDKIRQSESRKAKNYKLNDEDYQNAKERLEKISRVHREVISKKLQQATPENQLSLDVIKIISQYDSIFDRFGLFEQRNSGFEELENLVFGERKNSRKITL